MKRPVRWYPGQLLADSIFDKKDEFCIVLYLVPGEEMLDEECHKSSRRYDWFRVLRSNSDGTLSLGWLNADAYRARSFEDD